MFIAGGVINTGSAPYCIIQITKTSLPAPMETLKPYQLHIWSETLLWLLMYNVGGVTSLPLLVKTANIQGITL